MQEALNTAEAKTCHAHPPEPTTSLVRSGDLPVFLHHPGNCIFGLLSYCFLEYHRSMSETSQIVSSSVPEARCGAVLKGSHD